MSGTASAKRGGGCRLVCRNLPVPAAAHTLEDELPVWIAAGADVIGVSGDTAESHRAFARQHKLSFPLISDADGSLRKAFAVPKTMGLFPGRVTYVIDQAGIIRQIFSAQFASDEHVRQALIAVGKTTAQSKENEPSW